MEKVAVGYFKRRSAVRPPPTSSADAVHFLNPDERRALKQIEYAAVLRAGGAGAFAATLGATISVVTRPILGDEPSGTTWYQYLEYFGLTVLFMVPVAVVELSFIYWNAIASVHKLAAAAGIALFRDDDDATDNEDEMFAAVLARAALEIPNPPRPLFGIDPRREASKTRLLLATVLYKLKVALTNFLLRRLLVRVFGRAGMRSWIPFVSVPITAMWDAFVCRRALREARLRAMGPSAAVEIVECLLHGVHDVSPRLRELMLRAVGAAVVRSGDFHPNLVSLFEVLRRRFGGMKTDGFDDVRVTLEMLQRVDPGEQAIGLKLLSIACVFDGRIRSKEWHFLEQAYASTGRTFSRGAVQAWRRAFMNGDGLGGELMAALVTDPSPRPQAAAQGDGPGKPDLPQMQQSV